jgi:SNF2 family DNA or RNA helicase
VVIHYDRWWNAAREDQATDRVHRIGQTRGVQVFKLVTEGTLEEKIAAIINRKRALVDTILQEDDPELVKTFSRQELIEMLAMADF